MYAQPVSARAIMAIIAGMALALTNLAADAAELRIAAQKESDPKFVVLHQDGKRVVGGLCVDIMRAIERVEPGITFVGADSWFPFIRIVTGVATGQLDVACGFLRNQEREAKFDYIEPPLFSVNYFLVVRADDQVQVNGWDDIRKLGRQGVILINHGFGMSTQLERVGGLKVDSGGQDSKANLGKLLAGRGRFYIHRSPGIKADIIKAALQDKVKILPIVMHTEEFFMVVSKKLAPELREKLRRAIVQTNASGELATLFKQWDEGKDEAR
jgi:polar amino acid transport system substrate-binding protein